MNLPPAARPIRDIRLSPADGEVLLKREYELRANDGTLVCLVSRRRAESGIASGCLELWRGPHGVYLRAVYTEAERITPHRATPAGPAPQPWLALSLAPRGAVTPRMRPWPDGYPRPHPACGQVGGFRVRRVGPAKGVG